MPFVESGLQQKNSLIIKEIRKDFSALNLNYSHKHLLSEKPPSSLFHLVNSVTVFFALLLLKQSDCLQKPWAFLLLVSFGDGGNCIDFKLSPTTSQTLSLASMSLFRALKFLVLLRLSKNYPIPLYLCITCKACTLVLLACHRYDSNSRNFILC